MSKISGKNTKPEITIRKITHGLGYRYRLHKKDLPGKPDLVFAKRRKVIFVNGCFWHGHKNCSRSKLPISNNKFWSNKIRDTIKKDKKNYLDLKKLEWKYLVIWECHIKKSNRIKLAQKISEFLNE